MSDDRLKIAVVGAGAAAAAAVDALLRHRPGVAITLFDIGAAAPPLPAPPPATAAEIRGYYDGLYRQVKRRLGLRFPPIKTHLGSDLPRQRIDGRNRFFHSELFGGLTHFWGGTVLPFEPEDLRGWPVGTDELRRHYREAAELVGIAGEADPLTPAGEEELGNRPPPPLLAGIARLRDHLAEPRRGAAFTLRCGINRVALETRPGHPHRCVRCGECMAGCFTGAVYCAADSLRPWIDGGRVRYVRGEVWRFDPAGGALAVRRDDGGEERFAGFDRILLAAGTPGTTAIVMRSLGIAEGPVLLDNAIFQFPILNLGGPGDADKARYFSLTSLILRLDPHPGTPYLPAQLQLYPNFDYLWRSAVPEPLWPLAAPLSNLVRDRLLWGRLYLHSELSHAYRARLDGDGRLGFSQLRGPRRDALPPLLAELRAALKGSGYWIPPVPPSAAATSSHLAGTLPYGGGIAVSDAGEVAPGVYICDASCFPTGPAASPTLTIMANARRTALAATAPPGDA